MKLPYRLLVGIRRHLAQSSVLLGFALLLGTGGIAMSSVIDSKHNLSASGPGPVKATSETQMCVFCHTPHGGDQTAGAPLWSRPTSTASYIPYLSISMDTVPGAPGASSKVCLSCHDGTLAIGLVVNLNGNAANIAMSGTGAGGVMPGGSGVNTGETRNLGIDLSNDHPISFTYDTTLSNNDGELRPPPVVVSGNTVVGNRSFGVKPTFPLESDQMQCPTCHDPHLSTNSSPKFLRGNRLQQAMPSGGSYSPANDIMCLACHDKDKAVATWSNSAHSNINVANEAYTNAAADMREFPHGTAVWQASCVNCHDPHSVQGARRLLREGTDSPLTPKSGGQSAIEETCYQCHSSQATSVLNQNSPPNITPDIKSDFVNSTFHMPICCATETHNIGGSFNDSSGGMASGATGRCNTAGDQCSKDLMESEALLGKGSGNSANRHAECTDCHNPHRTIKNRLFNASGATPDAAGTHQHNIDIANPVAHSNIASGSLRGSFGVEPVYMAANFGVPGIPSSFDVKRGDPGLGGTSNVGNSYVTREYQVCFKCHSNYAYDNPDLFGRAYNPAGTPIGTNGFNTYLNTAMELQAPVGHKAAPAFTTDSGAYQPLSTSPFAVNNYRSWHPVTDSTGRTVANRGNASPNLWRSPWNGSDTDGPTATLQVITGAVGNQTMYCSDCHGTVNASANGVVPDNNGSVGFWTEDGNPWGPHGSAENFILKGPSNTTAPLNPTAAPVTTLDTLCFRCHDAAQYADGTGVPATALNSGFSAAGNDVAYNQPMNNLHQRHAYYTTQGGVTHTPPLGGAPYVSQWPAGANGSYRCTMCHTGAAHGWKNKGFLVNLNDLGPELDKTINSTAGGALGGEISLSNSSCNSNTTLCTGDPVLKGTTVPAAMAPVVALPGISGYTNGPYYQGALLYMNGFKASGNWIKGDCANAGCH